MKIKNWRDFQHYKHRNPPWIKFHKTLLDDPEWHTLPPLASKVLAMCWLVASERDGELPPISKLAFRLRMSADEASEQISLLSHWICFDLSELLADGSADASAVLAEGSARDRDRDRVKTETEAISALSGGASIFVPPTPEADYYRRFKEICGPNSGGLAKKLLTAYGARIELARSNLEMAATKGDPREFIGGTIRRLTQSVTESVGGIS